MAKPAVYLDLASGDSFQFASGREDTIQIQNLVALAPAIVTDLFIDSVGSVNLGGVGSTTSIIGNIVSIAAGLANDLTFGARGASLTLNQVGNENLVGFPPAVTSIVAAINDVKATVGLAGLQGAYNIVSTIGMTASRDLHFTTFDGVGFESNLIVDSAGGFNFLRTDIANKELKLGDGTDIFINPLGYVNNWLWLDNATNMLDGAWREIVMDGRVTGDPYYPVGIDIRGRCNDANTAGADVWLTAETNTVGTKYGGRVYLGCYDGQWESGGALYRAGATFLPEDGAGLSGSYLYSLYGWTELLAYKYPATHAEGDSGVWIISENSPIYMFHEGNAVWEIGGGGGTTTFRDAYSNIFLYFNDYYAGARAAFGTNVWPTSGYGQYFRRLIGTTTNVGTGVAYQADSVLLANVRTGGPDYAGLCVWNADPNGVCFAPRGSLLLRTDTGAAYVNTNNAATWLSLGFGVDTLQAAYDGYTGGGVQLDLDDLGKDLIIETKDVATYRNFLLRKKNDSSYLRTDTQNSTVVIGNTSGVTPISVLFDSNLSWVRDTNDRRVSLYNESLLQKRTLTVEATRGTANQYGGDVKIWADGSAAHPDATGGGQVEIASRLEGVTRSYLQLNQNGGVVNYGGMLDSYGRLDIAIDPASPAGSPLNVSNSRGPTTVTATGGTFTVNATGQSVTLDCAALDVDATSASHIASSTTLALTAANDLTLGARGATITLNQLGEENLDVGFSATSIIGALNELLGSGVFTSLQGAYNNGNTIVMTPGRSVVFTTNLPGASNFIVQDSIGNSFLSTDIANAEVKIGDGSSILTDFSGYLKSDIHIDNTLAHLHDYGFAYYRDIFMEGRVTGTPNKPVAFELYGKVNPANTAGVDIAIITERNTAGLGYGGNLWLATYDGDSLTTGINRCTISLAYNTFDSTWYTQATSHNGVTFIGGDHFPITLATPSVEIAAVGAPISIFHEGAATWTIGSAGGTTTFTDSYNRIYAYFDGNIAGGRVGIGSNVWPVVGNGQYFRNLIGTVTNAVIPVAQQSDVVLLANVRAGGPDRAGLCVWNADPNGVCLAPRGSLLLRVDTGTVYVSTSDVLSTWSALGTVAGSTLQAAYVSGNTINATAVEGPIDFTLTSDNFRVHTTAGGNVYFDNGALNYLSIVGATGAVDLHAINANLTLGTRTGGSVVVAPVLGGSITLDTLGAGTISLDAAAASNFSTSAGILTLSGAGGVTITAGAILDVNASSVITIDGFGASYWNTDSGNVTLSTSTFGSVVLAPVSGGSITLDTLGAGGISLDATAASNFTTTVGALSLTSAVATTWGTTAGVLTLNGAGGMTLQGAGTPALLVSTLGKVGINSIADAIYALRVYAGGASAYQAVQLGGDGVYAELLVGTVNPSLGLGVAADPGSLFLRSSGTVYIKTGAAATAWTAAGTGVDNLQSAYDAYTGGGVHIALDDLGNDLIIETKDVFAYRNFILRKTDDSLYLRTDSQNSAIVLGNTSGATPVGVLFDSDLSWIRDSNDRRISLYNESPIQKRTLTVESIRGVANQYGGDVKIWADGSLVHPDATGGGQVELASKLGGITRSYIQLNQNGDVVNPGILLDSYGRLDLIVDVGSAAGSPLNISNTRGPTTITSTGGTFTVNATGQSITMDCTALDVDATAASHIASSATLSVTAVNDLTFGARGATITLNQLGDENLDPGFVSTSIIGALNELVGGGGASSLQVAYGLGNTIVMSPLVYRPIVFTTNGPTASEFILQNPLGQIFLQSNTPLGAVNVGDVLLNDVVFAARGSSLTFNQVGNAALVGFNPATTSVVAALNELKASPSGGVTATYTVGEAITIGNAVCMMPAGVIRKADNTTAGAQDSVIGFATQTQLVVGNPCVVALAGDVLTSTALIAGDMGLAAYLDVTGGVTTTPPGVAGKTLLPLGRVTATGAGTSRIAMHLGTAVVL